MSISKLVPDNSMNRDVSTLIFLLFNSSFDVSMEFSNDGDTEAWANNMFLLIKNNLTYPNEDFTCYQYGGLDYNVSEP